MTITFSGNRPKTANQRPPSLHLPFLLSLPPQLLLSVARCDPVSSLIVGSTTRTRENVSVGRRFQFCPDDKQPTTPLPEAAETEITVSRNRVETFIIIIVVIIIFLHGRALTNRRRYQRLTGDDRDGNRTGRSNVLDHSFSK